MMQAMTSHRVAARQAMRGAIVQARPAAWLLTFHRWLAQQSSACGLAGSAEQHPALQPWAAHALQAGHKKLVRGARGFERQGPRQRHALRLFVKRQRYASEFFETLATARSQAKYQGILHDLQTSLGRANDIHIALALLGGALRGDPDLGAGTAARSAVSFALGWLARQADEPVDRATLKALKTLKKRQAPWQGE
ncbi:MAG: CHAD domain-containing protein [Rhodoferax sp.]